MRQAHIVRIDYMARNNSLQRFRQIVGVLARYGFGYVINSKLKNNSASPKNLRLAFEELGPTFIKIGQILSTRPDILPSEYIEELQKLQDNTPSVPYSEIRKLFYKEFEKNVEDTFVEIEKIPIASASVAQAHKAILKDGKNVIIKVQRPDIRESMEMDISILKKIVKLTKLRLQDTLIDAKSALDEIYQSTKKELDFKSEALSIEKFSDLNKNITYIGVPDIIWDLTSEKILTMEYIDGTKITDTETLNNLGYNLDDIGKKLALSYFKQIFEDGFFHGDPHPGNLLVMDSKIYYIDFGIMGSFSDAIKSTLNDIIFGVVYKDIDIIIRSLISMSVGTGRINRNKLYEDIDYLLASYLSRPLESIKMSQLLGDIFDAAKRNSIQLPGDLILLIRGLIILEGVVAKISPNIKILDIAVSYMKSNKKFHFIPSFDELLINTYLFARDTMQLPSKIIKLSNSLLDGRLKVQLEHRNISKSAQDINKAINRLVFALIVSSLIIGSSLVINANVGPKLYGISVMGLLGFLAAAFMGFWLLISIMKSGKL